MADDITPQWQDEHADAPQERTSSLTWLVRWWRMIGAGSLLFSVSLHAIILIIAGLIVFTSTRTEKNVDFLPGGGTAQGEAASEERAHQIQQKRRSVLARSIPMQRVVSNNSVSDIQLPDMSAELISIPDMSSRMGGALSANGGFGKSGSGGGFGDGIGKGGLSGVTFKPISMFGRELKARRLGVVMDVSRSMTKYLPLVCTEIDRFAKGSPLVLYFGCGLTPVNGYKVDGESHPVGGKDFERYWRVWQGKTPLNTPPAEWKTVTFNPDAKFPLQDIYKIVSKRRDTYYIDFCGITHTWLAMLSDRFRFCDAIYWFSDFQDKVDQKQMERLKATLKERRQRLYMHASVRGRSFEKVRDELVIPLGGEVIEDTKQ